MTAIEPGRICVKTRGRNAGKYCVITSAVDDSFVNISGPKSLNKIKAKRCNIDHLAFTEKKLDIKENATEEEIEVAVKTAGMEDLFKDGLKF